MGNGATSGSRIWANGKKSRSLRLQQVDTSSKLSSAPAEWCLTPIGLPTKVLHPPPTEAEVREIMSVLETARALVSGGVQLSALQLLAESGRVEEWPPGSVVYGPVVWTAGLCLVLSGHASVILEAEGSDSIVATLEQGDSFGWDSRREQEERDDTWQRFNPRVAVADRHTLRLCRIVWDDARQFSDRRISKGISKSSGELPIPSTLICGPWQGRPCSKSQVNLDIHEMIGPARDSVNLSDWLARLWLSASAPPTGIGELPGGLLQAHFLAALWAPLLAKLDQHKAEIQSRQAKGFRIHDCFPLQGRQIVELKGQVLHLSEVWYGSVHGGNLSALYHWFMDSMQLLGVTAYSFSNIPKECSPDGWSIAVDGQARATALKEKRNVDASYVATGGAKQRQGRSAIDNTVLRNIFLPHEARELLVGRRLRKVLCKFLVIRQICILRRLSEMVELDLIYMASEVGTAKDHCVVRALLQSLPAPILQSAGADACSICGRALCERGEIIAGFGQLDCDGQKAVADQVRRLLHETFSSGEEPQPASQNSEDVFERLVAWSRDKPGDFFEGDKRRHVEVKIAGLLASKIIVIKRSCMERFSLARYFPLAWERSQPLWGTFATGPFRVRPAGMMEASHVRVNECPYAPLHGMSLSGGGFATDQSEKRSTVRKSAGAGYSLLMELQWVRDPSANVKNWFLTDIEKILQEAWQLNPHGRKSMMLPGEVFVNVGQNPKVGSSIQETQHTQLCEGSLESYPILQLKSRPCFSRKLGASVDLVELGPNIAPSEHCSLLLRFDTEQPTKPEFIEFLVALRLRLLEVFGGADSLDFLVLSVANGRGGFVVLFAPIAQLVKLGDEAPDFATWANPLTGESSESAGLEEARVDFGKAVGQFLVAKPALQEQILAGGEDLLRRIWAFNRVPGVRETVEGFIRDRRVFDIIQ